MRLHRLLGGRKLSWICRRCHRQLLPTRTSPRRPSACGRSRATPGSPYHRTRRPSASRSRGEITSGGPVPGYLLPRRLGLSFLLNEVLVVLPCERVEYFQARYMTAWWSLAYVIE